MSQPLPISRRTFLRLSATVSLGALLAACAAAGSPASSEGGEATVNISVFVFEEGEGDVQSQTFMEMHPEVNIEIIPALGEETKLASMIAAGTAPDIFPYAEVDFIDHISANTLLNLQPFVDADPDFDLAAYFPDIVATSQAPDGDLYGLGNGFGAQLLYYNQTLFDAAGLTYPDESWTWQNMLEAAPQLTQGEGTEQVYGTMPHNWWAVQLPLIWQNGGASFSEDGSTCLMDSPEAIEALDYMVNFVRQGWAPTPQQISGMGMESGQLFAAGRAALMPGGHWEFGAFEDADGFEWDVTAVPGQKQDATFLHQAIWGASSATEFPQVCWDWIKFFCSAEESEKYRAEFGGQSSLIAVAQQLAEDISASGAATASQKVGRALLYAAEGGRSDTRVRGFLEVMDSVWNPAIDMLWSGDYTAEQAGQEIARGANLILQRGA